MGESCLDSGEPKVFSGEARYGGQKEKVNF